MEEGEDPVREEAGRGTEAKKSPDSGAPRWVRRRCRRRRRRAQAEQRAPGGRRCSRSGRWRSACWASGRLSSGCEAGSDAAGWTSQSPGRGNAEVERQQEEVRHRGRSSGGGAERERVSLSFYLFEAAQSVQSPLPLLTHSGVALGFVLFLGFFSLYRKQQQKM